MQTVRGKQDKPLTGKQGQRDFEQDCMHRPTIKGLYYSQMWLVGLVDELQNTAVAVIGDFIYIANMTKPGTNRH